MELPVVADSLSLYLAEINRFPLLSREEEYELAMRYRKKNDLEAAHRLILSNLRFVVKIACEYRHFGFRLLDLIQEGNIGLMMAVKKFDPTRGVRLISYAVRWIRAYIQDFILRSWSLVKLGTAQRRLFHKRALPEPDHERLGERDLSLDQGLSEDSDETHLDLLSDVRPNQEEVLGELEERENLKGRVEEALKGLSSKERFIIEKRILSDHPMTLREIGELFHISKERVRQIEGSALRKLKANWPRDCKI